MLIKVCIFVTASILVTAVSLLVAGCRQKHKNQICVHPAKPEVIYEELVYETIIMLLMGDNGRVNQSYQTKTNTRTQLYNV